MADIITTFHPENDENTNLYPNIKKENIPNKSIDRTKLDDSINSLLNSINELHPSGTDTSTHILAFTENKGIYIGTDNGHWYYWDGEQYVDGGVYQTTEGVINDSSISNTTTFSSNRINDENEYINDISSEYKGIYEKGHIGITDNQLTYVNSNSTIRLIQNKYINLQVGDKIYLKNWNNRRIRLMYENNDLTWGRTNWFQYVFTITNSIYGTGRFTLILSYVDESIISDINDILKYLVIERNGTQISVINSLIYKLPIISEGDVSIKASSLINGLYNLNNINNMIDVKQTGCLMVHCSSFCIINDIVYLIYLNNTTNTGETPRYININLAVFSLNDMNNISYYPIASIGDNILGGTITEQYDAFIYYDGVDLHILWNCKIDNSQFTILHTTFDINTLTISTITKCNITSGTYSEIFTAGGIKTLFRKAGIPLNVDFSSHICFSINTNLYNGYYYFTICVDKGFTCILKSNDFINFEYVSQPNFKHHAQFETSSYILGNYLYLCIRQEYSYGNSILTRYDLVNNVWDTPYYINDAQSRSCFIYTNSSLYLVHSKDNRNSISVLKIDTSNIINSYEIENTYKEKYFYPFVFKYNNTIYMSVTNDRKSIYFGEITLEHYSINQSLTLIKNLLNI